jgi:hypothetical protein
MTLQIPSKQPQQKMEHLTFLYKSHSMLVWFHKGKVDLVAVLLYLPGRGASTDTGPKSTRQVVNGTSNSTKLTLMKNESSDSITFLRSQNVNPVSQKPEPSHPWVPKSVKSHAPQQQQSKPFSPKQVGVG